MYTWCYYKSETTPPGQGLPGPATLLFNHLVHSIMSVLDRKPVSIDNDDSIIKN